MTAAAHPLALERFAPAYQFRERHSRRVRATPERIHRAVWEVTADEIFLFRTLIWIRRLGRPLPPSVLNVPPHTSLLAIATRTTFLTLVDSLREIVIATVVSRPKGSSRPRSPDELRELRTRPGYVLATMNFAVEPAGDVSTLSTETRVFATDGASRLRFAAYWAVISLGSAFIRIMWLRAIQRRAEASEDRLSRTEAS
jgi:hypothetical protein